MGQLLAAWYYAHDSQKPVWDFAVEIERLNSIGLTPNDLRWLSAKGYIDHAVETSNSCNGHRRRFRAQSALAFNKRSCIVLTDPGITFARRIYRPTPRFPANPDADTRRSAQPPCWDAATRMLWLGSSVVKRFKLPAPNQERILASLQEEGWPSCIDDPLPPTPGVNSKRRLHDTIFRLNRGRQNRLIRFTGNGNGLAIHWERTPTGAATDNRETPERI